MDKETKTDSIIDEVIARTIRRKVHQLRYAKQIVDLAFGVKAFGDVAGIISAVYTSLNDSPLAMGRYDA